jgi:hypothetical protein
LVWYGVSATHDRGPALSLISICMEDMADGVMK